MNYLLLCLSVLALLNLALVKSQDDSFIQYFRKVDRKRSTDSEYLIKIADLKEEILSLKKEVNEEKNSKSLLQSQNHEFYQRIIEDKNEITILKEKIIELNHSVNEEKNNKSILEKENSELKKKIQKFCGLFDQDGSENIIQALEKGSLNGVKYWHCKDPSSIHANNGTYFNWTPLHYASRNGQLDIVEFLLSKGVDVNEEDSSNVTPLMSASYNGNVHVVKALLDKGAKINHQDADKWTPLHFAVDNNKLPVVKLLIERGADRSLRNGRNLTPLDWAREEGLKSIEDYLSSL